MTRTPCYDCVRKHLAQAKILNHEMFLGYPEHHEFVSEHMEHAETCLRYWTAMGHMAEASDELEGYSHRMASKIREERLKMQADPNHRPDFDGMILEVTRMTSEAVREDVEQ